MRRQILSIIATTAAAAGCLVTTLAVADEQLEAVRAKTAPAALTRTAANSLLSSFPREMIRLLDDRTFLLGEDGGRAGRVAEAVLPHDLAGVHRAFGGGRQHRLVLVELEGHQIAAPDGVLVDRHKVREDRQELLFRRQLAGGARRRRRTWRTS